MRKNTNIQNLALTALLTALVIVLQLLGQFIRFGIFSVSLVLVPIVLGAALLGPIAATWLGTVFGTVVLLQPDTQAFLSISVPGTIITVLLKGALCGLIAGLVFSLLKKKNPYLACAAAAVVCPIVNTGIFLIGCLVFFLPTITAWGAAAGFASTAEYMIVGFVGLNFIAELIFNIVLTPAIIRLLALRKKD